MDAGTARLVYDDATLRLGFDVDWTGLSGTTTVAHIHCFTTGFLNNFGGSTVLGARNALLAGMSAGTAYFNIHSTRFPPGEIRGFLQVPEPGSLALALAALGLLAAGAPAARRGRQR